MNGEMTMGIRNRVWLSGLLAVAAFSLTANLMAEDEKGTRQFRAGAAASNITPPLGERVIGGFAPFPSTNVHDELHARCLILDDGTTQVGFVICDNLGIRREVYDAARELIAKETSIPPQNILMAATHTHSATPSSSETYQPFLVRRIADTVRRALANLQPARIGWGSVDEPTEVFNRRWFVADPDLCRNPFGGVDRVRMNPPRGHAALVKPAGPIDPEVSFISVQNLEGDLIALLANYSLHYVGGVNKGEVSADYFGIFAERIGELLAPESSSPPFVGMLSNGTSGDINNINFREKYERREPYEKMRDVAELIAQDVARAHASIEFHDWVPVASANSELTLQFRKPDAEMIAYFEGILDQPADAKPYHRYERNYAERVQRLLEGPDEVSIPLQVVRVGDLAVAAIPFEVFVEIGLEIKDRTPFADAFTIELANDYHGYLPTPQQHELGGYETWMGTNRVQLDASEKITSTILNLMKSLSDTPTNSR